MATRSPAAFRQELVDIEVVGPEAGLAVGEVEVPHALEGGAAPELPHGAVGGDGLGAVLTGFDVTVTGRCSTSCLAQLQRDAAVPDEDSRRAGQSREPRRTRAASRPPATAQGCRQGAGIVALKSALRPARAVLKVAGPRTSPWMIYWRRGSSRDGVLSRPRRGRFRPVPGHGLVSAKPKAPPASALTAATEYSRPR